MVADNPASEKNNPRNIQLSHLAEHEFTPLSRWHRLRLNLLLGLTGPAESFTTFGAPRPWKRAAPMIAGLL